MTTSIKYFLTIIFLFAGLGSLLAQPGISFETSEFDFGEIYEGDVAVHEFRFVNSGTEPLLIQQVKASCGCTTPYWTKEPILPGASGVIKASYNSKGRPGNFRKSIRINSNAGDNPVSYVYIKGTATSKPLDSYSAEERAQSPVLSTSTLEFQLGKVENGHAIPVTVSLSNTGKTPLLIRSLRSACNCVYFESNSNRSFEPGQTGELRLIYRSNGEGKRLDKVSIISNDISQAPTEISIVSEVVASLQEGSPMKKSTNGFKF